MSVGRVSLVTGASGGIGRAVVERLVETGRTVIATGRKGDALGELEARFPGRVIPLVADLAVAGEADALYERALGVKGQLSELVCAAGIVHYAPVGQVSERDLRAQLELNFVAAFLLGQRVGKHLEERGAGSMVFVASTLGARPAKLTSAYGASKAALISMAQAFALELAPRVRVNVVAPGIVDTPMVRVARDGSQLDAAGVQAQLERLAAIHPLERLGTPDEVAQAVLFALDASWMTGSVITVDGGVSLA
ncbi:MAG: SDR family oxidoreductase [Myxococcales bacterium]